MSSKIIVRVLWGSYLAAALYWCFRFWGHFPAFMDTLEYVFPEKWFNVESFRNGLIPLWNPYLDCGTPHLANLQSAPFYPFFWLWNWTGLADWFFGLAILHGILASVGFYLWLRSLKVSKVSAALCSVSFGGSALLTHYWGFPTHMASVAWVPWIFWGTHRLSREFSWSNWIWVVFFWSCQILAGYPFTSFYAGLFLLGYVLFRIGRSVRIGMIHGSALMAALLVTCCQWLPFLDFLGYLHREGTGAQIYSLRWVNYLTLFQPDLLGYPGTGGYRGDYPSFIFNNLYLGLIPLGLWVWSFFSSVAQDAFWKRAALFWMVWPAGVHFTLWRLLSDPLLDHLEPAKASFLFVFCALTAAALALQEKDSSIPRKSPARKWAWVLGLFWFADILGVPSRIIQTVPDPYRDAEVVRSAAKARDWTGNGRMMGLRNKGDYYPAGEGSYSDSLKETAKSLLPNTNVVWGLRSARGYLSVCVDGHQNLTRYLDHGYPFDGRVLDAAGVKLIIFPGILPSFKHGIFERDGRSVFTRNAGAMGIAWEAERVREFASRKEIFEALLDPKAFLENEVYTEKDPVRGAVRLSPSLRSWNSRSLTILERMEAWSRRWSKEKIAIKSSRPSPCEAGFELEYSHGGFLVFNESFSPGWHAWLDGIPKPIFRAYGFAMAVPLGGEGRHQVSFRYEPTSFRLGLFLTLMSLAAFAGAILIKRQSLLDDWLRNLSRLSKR